MDIYDVSLDIDDLEISEDRRSVRVVVSGTVIEQMIHVGIPAPLLRGVLLSVLTDGLE